MAKVYDLKQLPLKVFENINEIWQFIEFTREINTIDENKHSREWWAISAYAYSKLINNTFQFPITVYKCSKPKPDFFIESNNEKHGVEITFCSEEKYEQAKSICKAKKDGSYPINTSFMKDELNYFDNSHVQFPEQDLHGMPIYGDYAVSYTIDRLQKCIIEKIDKYKDFESEYCLAVYVNLPSRIYIDDNCKVKILKVLSMQKNWANTFKSIEIIWSKENVIKLDI